jgi:hypothetical protein
VTWDEAAKRARTTLRQLMPTEMKSRTVSGATPDWPSALMNCCALMLAWLAKAVTPPRSPPAWPATPKRSAACT